MIEITGTYENEPCDHCEQYGTRDNQVIEFHIESKENEFANMRVHQKCLAQILAGYGTGIPIAP